MTFHAAKLSKPFAFLDGLVQLGLIVALLPSPY